MKISYIFFFGILFLIGTLFLMTILPFSDSARVVVVASLVEQSPLRTGSVAIVKMDSTFYEDDIVAIGQSFDELTVTPGLFVSSDLSEGGIRYTVLLDLARGATITEIEQRDVLGKVIFSIPWVGLVVNFVRSPIGFLIFVVLPAIVLVVDELFSLKRSSKQTKQNNQKSDVLNRAVADARKQREARIKRKKMQLETSHKFIRAPKDKES